MRLGIEPRRFQRMKETAMSEENFSQIAPRLLDVQSRLQEACRRAGREVVLMAVSKTFPAEAVEAAAAAGQRVFGENYAQEGCAKIEALKASHPELALQWHFIGPLQANKTRMVAEHFDWVDSIDRLKIAQRLNDQRPEGLALLNVLIEVNIDAEDTKSGVAPAALEELIAEVKKLPRLRLRGLMTIPAPAASKEEQMKPLRAMKKLFDELAPRYGLDVLSMGMSADMVAAVEAGSTMVRVGSAIFGARTYPNKA